MKQNTIRMGILLLGLRQRVAVKYLEAHGFTEEDLEEGWRYFYEVARLRRNGPGKTVARDLLARCDALENQWFPIARLALARHFPAVAEALFEGLARSNGKAASWNVAFFLDRLGAMENGHAPFGGDGPLARALLTKRGLTSEILAPVAESLVKLRTLEEVDGSAALTEEHIAAETVMMDWYREWSGIALRVIANRNTLRSLGLRRRGPARNVEESDELLEIEDGLSLPVLPAPVHQHAAA